MSLSIPIQVEPVQLVIVLLLALALDLIFSEPPFVVHPVVWMGKLIDFFKKNIPQSHRVLYGVFVGLTTILFACSMAWLVGVWLGMENIPLFVRYLLAAYFLKATFAVRCLIDASKEVRLELEADRLDKAREKMAMYVSRDTSELTKEQISSAIIESTSENYVDTILTPMMFYACFGSYGLIAAYAFKAASTLDSMVGYKREPFTQVGRFSAKLDDLLNWIPARLSVLFLATAAILVNLFHRKSGVPDWLSGLKTAKRDARKTPSPNSGFPMSYIAGALRIKLEKPGYYVLGEHFDDPLPLDIKFTAQITAAASFLTAGASALILLFNPFSI
ncbi:MAG: cobalamin biosynthesis protein [Acidobacteria bacterium]|nr:MAG: cobalamin biosynthesis protein [Acidobacteriota bacterium]PIE90973.1 MAG: cobalamin biosynthesis protein [Acidobacteriota bacterium]